MENKKINEGDIVLCTVKNISGTTVFLDIDDKGEGTMVVSEVSPGRIRNLRDYVTPGRKVVCKVLKVSDSGNAHLSLRRVKEKERKIVMDKYQWEKSAINILGTIIKDKKKADEIRDKIKKDTGENIYNFFQKAKENPKILEKYLGKEEIEKLLKILEERKEKSVEVKKDFKLSSKNENGVELLKNVLREYEKNIIYNSAGNFTLKIKDKNYKEANKKLDKILEEIKKKSDGMDFEVKEK